MSLARGEPSGPGPPRSNSALVCVFWGPMLLRAASAAAALAAEYGGTCLPTSLGLRARGDRALAGSEGALLEALGRGLLVPGALWGCCCCCSCCWGWEASLLCGWASAQAAGCAACWPWLSCLSTSWGLLVALKALKVHRRVNKREMLCVHGQIVLLGLELISGQMDLLAHSGMHQLHASIQGRARGGNMLHQARHAQERI
eukprot:1157862-Pelagomonas_calceolata.AAC.10